MGALIPPILTVRNPGREGQAIHPVPRIAKLLGPLPSSFPPTVLTLVLGDGQRQEGAEGGKGDCREESTHEEEAT